jgi:hypothetical protein
MSRNKNDWYCPTCKFTIWGSKPKCLKCGHLKPVQALAPRAKNPVLESDDWEPGNPIKPVEKVEKPVLESEDLVKNMIRSDLVRSVMEDLPNPKIDKGPYSRFKGGGYYGPPIDGEPLGLKYPKCGCKEFHNCPQRHHEIDCRCYTCRCKTHKW